MKYAPPIGSTDPNAGYVDRSGNTPGSPVPAAAIEPTMREIQNVITRAGLTPDSNDLTQLWQAITGRTRTVLTSNLTLYIRIGGNDNNDGLSPTTALATLQGAVDRMAQFDGRAKFRCSVDIGAGTFAGAYFAGIGSCGFIIVDLKGTSTGSTILTGSGSSYSSTIVLGFIGDVYSVSNLTIKTTPVVDVGISAHHGAHVRCDNVAFVGTSTISESGAAVSIYRASVHLYGGSFTESFNYVIYPTCSSHAQLVGTFSVSGAHRMFIAANHGSSVFSSATFIGARTGMRFQTWTGSAIWTDGLGPNHFPGNAAGIINTALYT